MNRKHFSLLGALGLMVGLVMPTSAVGSVDPPAPPDSGVIGPRVRDKVTPLLSAPVRDLPAAARPHATGEADSLLADGPVIDLAETGAADPVGQLEMAATLALNPLGPPIVNVPGMGGANPNDTNGDIGPNDYVQMINSAFQIFDRQGNPRAPAAAISTLWASNPAGQTECSTRNDGDPIVLYDRQADRWLLSQFARTEFLCFAISQTNDPTGAYFLYQFTVDRFPDYYKVGIWPDGYYVSANFNGPNTAMALVLDRANMLFGNPAGQVEFEIATLDDNFDILIPSNMEGPTPPPAGTPNYFYRQADAAIVGGVDRLELWEFDTDWIVPANTTLTGPTDIPTAPFDSDTCGYGFVQCIEQPGTAQELDPIQIGTMYRFPYRNYGDREVMVGNFTVDANGADGVGIRWFMLERAGGPWTIVNEGTYAPQPGGAQPFIHRWMGSVNVDRFGNMALGYTASSSQNIFPSARYTGRDADDPLGLMPATEYTIQAGVSATLGNRWGDYYTMSVDPVDDCTFWYTGDRTGAGGFRQSQIASFRFADCATDLEITKTLSPAHPNAGDEVVYTITVTNAGPIPAANVVVTDVLPAQVAYLANTDSCTGVAVGATGTLTCSLGTLGDGDSMSFDVKVRVNPDLGGATSITNTATVSSDANESDPSDNVATLTHLVNELADVRVTKLCKPDSGPAPAGTSGTCTILVTNDGPSAARAVQLTDTHVSDGAFSLSTSTPGCVAGATQVTCTLGKIQPGATVRVDVGVTSNDGVDVNDVAIATSATPDPNPGNNQGEAGLSFAASADLTITKSGPASAVAGTNFNYTLTVDNLGPSAAAGVVVNDELPPGVDFVSAVASVGSFTAVAGTITWNLGTVAVADPPATLTITVHVRPDVTAAQLVNNTSVTSATSDPDTANNLASWTTAVQTVANLTLVKTDSPDPVIAGNPLTYTVTVGNNGPSTAQDVVVTDTLPGNVTLVSAVGGTGTTACAEVQIGVVSCEVGDLDPGESETIFITVTVASSATGQLVNNVVASSPTDADGAAAQATTDVITRADLWMEKRGEAPAGNPAGALIYRLIVHNHPGSAPDDTPTSGAGGPSDAQNVVVTDNLPLTSKKMIVQFLTPGCTYDPVPHRVTCTAATVPFGTSVVFEVQVQIRGSVGTITNTATVTSSTTDPVLGNNSDNVNNVVQGSTGQGKKP